MKKSALTVLIALLPLAAIAQTPSINEDGKKIDVYKRQGLRTVRCSRYTGTIDQDRYPFKGRR